VSANNAKANFGYFLTFIFSSFNVNSNLVVDLGKLASCWNIWSNFWFYIPFLSNKQDYCYIS